LTEALRHVVKGGVPISIGVAMTRYFPGLAFAHWNSNVSRWDEEVFPSVFHPAGVLRWRTRGTPVRQGEPLSSLRLPLAEEGASGGESWSLLEGARIGGLEGSHPDRDVDPEREKLAPVERHVVSHPVGQTDGPIGPDTFLRILRDGDRGGV
jgi:hypothetical protein